MLVHWIWLAERKALSDRDKMRLLEHFRDAEEIYYAPASQLSQLEWLEQKETETLLDKDLSPAEKILRQCAEKKISILTFRDAAYPPKLKHIADPPPVLYYKGILPDFESAPVIGIVGTRSASAYGLTTAKRMGYQIARCGGMIVSGMAKGIDGNAMQGALTAGGFVIGVLGCGVDVIYPKSNTALYHDLEDRGCVISEHPPGTEPIAWHFPRRNRIISGISNGVLVVEAPKVSGALNTARWASEQGRDVFAVPGNIDVESCAGSNALIGDIAYPALSGWAVLSEYQDLYPDTVRQNKMPEIKTEIPEEIPPVRAKADKIIVDKRTDCPYSVKEKRLPELTGQEKAVVEVLGPEPVAVDQVIDRLGWSPAAVMTVLTKLTVKGVVKNHPGKLVSRN